MSHKLHYGTHYPNGWFLALEHGFGMRKVWGWNIRHVDNFIIILDIFWRSFASWFSTRSVINLLRLGLIFVMVGSYSSPSISSSALIMTGWLVLEEDMSHQEPSLWFWRRYTHLKLFNRYAPLYNSVAGWLLDEDATRRRRWTMIAKHGAGLGRCRRLLLANYLLSVGLMS